MLVAIVFTNIKFPAGPFHKPRETVPGVSAWARVECQQKTEKR